MNELVEHLAAGVHQAWMEEKLRQGFADHPWQHGVHQVTRQWNCERSDFHDTLEWVCRQCGLPQDKHHTDMLPYDDLPEHIKEYDRVTVKRVLADLSRYLERAACES